MDLFWMCGDCPHGISATGVDVAAAIAAAIESHYRDTHPDEASPTDPWVRVVAGAVPWRS